MTWGTLSQWAVFAFGVIVLLVGQIVQGKISRAVMSGEISNLKNEIDRTKSDVEQNTQCIANIEKRSTDFLTVPDFNRHTASCKQDRLEESHRKDTEFNSLRDEVVETRKSVESTASKVDQLLALQTGTVQ